MVKPVTKYESEATGKVFDSWDLAQSDELAADLAGMIPKDTSLPHALCIAASLVEFAPEHREAWGRIGRYIYAKEFPAELDHAADTRRPRHAPSPWPRTIIQEDNTPTQLDGIPPERGFPNVINKAAAGAVEMFSRRGKREAVS